VLLYFVRVRRDMPFPRIFLMFGAFIVSCGLGHLMEAITTQVPLYRLSGLLKLETALVSWATVIVLVPLIPRALAMRSPEEMQSEIDERKLLEERLARLAAIVEFSDDAIISMTLAGEIVSWNTGAETMYGYASGEVLGGSVTLIVPPDRHGELAEILERVQRRDPVSQHETERMRKDGRRIQVSLTVSPIKDAAGQIVGASAIARDITERKRLEEDLSERKRLEGELRQRAEALARADRAKDQFLAMLAHELRNPLGAIGNAIQLLKLRGADDPRLIRAHEIIDRQVRHQTRLLDDLLNVSRLARGKISLSRIHLDLRQLVRDTAEDFRSTLERSGLIFSVELPESPLWVEGDPTRLSQVLGNLLHNAGKFTNPGGEVAVRLTAEAEPRRAVLTIRDTGIGIAPEMLPHVFETFVQADHSMDRSRGGLGLGLALVKGLVALHGGETHAESGGLGCGSTFTLSLPLRPSPAAADVETPTPGGAAGPVRVLIVEDNQDAADCLRDLLEAVGCRVEVAYSGPAGLEAAERFRPELVLCDLGLPGMDGYQVAAALRQNSLTAGGCLVAVSGYGREEDQRRSREAGFDLHLTKPVDFSDLRRLLDSWQEQAALPAAR
jgi:PAS domain S-box-containing protein